MQSPLRLFHTVRHLKPGQVTDRVSRRFRRIPSRPDGTAWRLKGTLPSLPTRHWQGEYRAGSFTFLNRSVAFEGENRWACPGQSALWAFNLHYFRYLLEVDYDTGLTLIEDWIADNPPAAQPGWHPYTSSLRVREWLEWLVRSQDLPVERRNSIVLSVIHQVLVLESRLELHLLGNHLLENAITLCWAALRIECEHSERWLRAGEQLLARELRVQVLEDGTHDERSPMYQALIAEHLLRLRDVGRDIGSKESHRIAELAGSAGQRLAMTLAMLTHPDDCIALLNDSAFDGAPRLKDLQGRFPDTAMGPPAAPTGPWTLPQSGYMGWRGPLQSYLVFDAGPLGPDWLVGHGHADLLSFELSHRDHRLVADTGVFTYEVGATRDYDRSTLELDGASQADLWAAFRCGRRPRVLVSRPQAAAPGEAGLVGAYRGPSGSLGAVSHERSLRITDSVIEGNDRVQAHGNRTACVRFHLAPGIAAVHDGAALLLSHDGLTLARLVSRDLEWSLAASPYHPRFGVEIERVCIECRHQFRDRFAAKWSLELL